MKERKDKLSWKMMEVSEKFHIPHSAMIEITWRCNLNCEHCYLPEGQRRKSAREADELSTQEWFRVFDQMADLGILYLTISGGEVFMRPDFLEMVAYAREKGFDLRVYTTGTLLDPQKAQALVDHNVGKVELSVYGREETHDNLVRIPGSFARSIEAARVLKKGGIEVVIKCPLMNKNIQDYPYLVELAEKEGFIYKFDPTVVPRDDYDAETLSLRTFDKQLKDAFNDPRLQLTAQGEEAEDFELASPVCEAGRTYISIGPNGDVYPCIEWRTVLGNLKEKDLKTIWEGQKADKIRDFKREDFEICNTCELLPWCPRCTGLADREDGDALGPSREACYLAKLNYEVINKATPPLCGLEKATGERIDSRPGVDGTSPVQLQGHDRIASSHGCGSSSTTGCNGCKSHH